METLRSAVRENDGLRIDGVTVRSGEPENETVRPAVGEKVLLLSPVHD